MKLKLFATSALLAVASVASLDAQAELAYSKSSGAASSYQGAENELIQLFNSEVETAGSPLNKLIEKLKADNEPLSISTSIGTRELTQIESSYDRDEISTQYLILVRGGYKRGESVILFLKASTHESDEDGVVVRIDEAAEVTIK